MSSMGAASYRVETPEEIEARRRRAARERYRQAAVRHAALVTETAACRTAHGRTVSALRRSSEPSRHATADALEAAAERLETEASHARGLLDAQLAQVFRDELTALVARPAPRVTRRESTARTGMAGEQAEAARSREREESAERHRVLAERAADLLARLPTGTPAPMRERCAEDARQAVSAAGEEKARRILISLEDRVRAAERTRSAVEAAAEQAAALLARLEDVPGAQAAELADRLTAVIEDGRTQVPHDLVAEAERAVEEADTERARRIAARALAQVLADLDYHVAEGFETALVDRGTAHAALPGDTGYGLKILFDRGSSVLRHIVVRDAEADGGQSADRRAQRTFCDALPSLVAGLGQYHVRLRTGETEEPGQRPVPHVGAGVVPRRERGGGQEREAQA
ncbi:hypothetical protein ACFVU0_34815 [Streptomyces sp. NPDC058122]|uniref:hypothetical protein n=1 Tax=Streptomyces sp. NPDC058122 TaxID=3346349 RepID=UPI0036EAA504